MKSGEWLALAVGVGVVGFVVYRAVSKPHEATLPAPSPGPMPAPLPIAPSPAPAPVTPPQAPAPLVPKVSPTVGQRVSFKLAAGLHTGTVLETWPRTVVVKEDLGGDPFYVLRTALVAILR